MRNFRELAIWQRSFELVNDIYEGSVNLPIDEKLGVKKLTP